MPPQTRNYTSRPPKPREIAQKRPNLANLEGLWEMSQETPIFVLQYPYSVSKGFCLPPLRRVIPGGIFFVLLRLAGIGTTATPPPGVHIKLPDTLQIRHKCRSSGVDM